MKYLRLKNFTLFLFFLFLVNCQNKKEKTTQNNNVKTSVLSKVDISSIKVTEYILSDQSSKEVEDWTKYQELQLEIEALKNGKTVFFKEDIELIKTFIDELKSTIPDMLNYPEITTRLTALENATYNLHSECNLKRNSKNHLLKSIKDLLICASNLNLQINKKLEMDSQNIVKPQ